MLFQVLVAYYLANIFSLTGADSASPCHSADVDAAARQLLHRMATSVAGRLHTSERLKDSRKRLAVVGGVSDVTERSPVDAWAGTLHEMHTTLAAAGFDFELRPQQSSTRKIGSAISKAGATGGTSGAATAPKGSVVLAASVEATPMAAGVSSEDAAVAEALTVDGVKRAMRGEWPGATYFFLQATDANPFKVCTGLAYTRRLPIVFTSAYASVTLTSAVVVCSRVQAELWLNLGLAQARLGRKKAAQFSFERGLALDPSHATLRRHLNTPFATSGGMGAGEGEGPLLAKSRLVESAPRPRQQPVIVEEF